MDTRVNINYTPSNDTEKFGTFSLTFLDPDAQTHSVNIKFDPKDLWSFSRDTHTVAFDFLITALIVYNVDRAINRQKYSNDGWQREITIENLPVINLDAMNRGRESLNQAISFLTGDSWDIHFTQAQNYDYCPTKKVRTFEIDRYKKVALFSGGLDSLIGFIDETSSLAEGEKILLVSHMELGKEHKDQVGLLTYCAQNNIFEGKYSQVLLNAGLKPSRDSMIKAESTFRSRSLLFFAAGIYVAFHINPSIKLIVPENGTISINIPLDRSRRSACSTRTTHPTFIKKVEKALTLIGINNKFINPYRLLSKADMVKRCDKDNNKSPILRALAPLSCSCAKRGHNSFWDKSSQEIKENHITHCGMCLPCIYRRVSLFQIGMDNANTVGTDIFNGNPYDINKKEQKRNRDFLALLYFLKNRMNAKIIRHELFMNGITDFDELEEYTALAIHSYEQVRDWIEANAPTEIKKKAGL